MDGRRRRRRRQRVGPHGFAWGRFGALDVGEEDGHPRLRAQIGISPGLGIPPVTITASALAGAAASIVVVSGDNQKAGAGSDLAKPLVFKVTDETAAGWAEPP